MNRHDIVIGVRVHEILVDQCTRRDDTGNTAIMQQAPRLDFVGGVVGEFLGDGNVSIQVLNEDFEEAVQLKEGEASLDGMQSEKLHTNLKPTRSGLSRAWHVFGFVCLMMREI